MRANAASLSHHVRSSLLHPVVFNVRRHRRRHCRRASNIAAPYKNYALAAVHHLTSLNAMPVD